MLIKLTLKCCCTRILNIKELFIIWPWWWLFELYRKIKNLDKVIRAFTTVILAIIMGYSGIRTFLQESMWPWKLRICVYWFFMPSHHVNILLEGIKAKSIAIFLQFGEISKQRTKLFFPFHLNISNSLPFSKS